MSSCSSNLNVTAEKEFLFLSVSQGRSRITVGRKRRRGITHRNPTGNKLSISAAILLRLLIFLE
jgi:hypothetical protein